MDNADDLPMAREFLPSSHNGYVLFTTRDQAAGMIAASIEVEKLSSQDGTLLLLRWSKRLDKNNSLDQAKAEDRAAAERIVEEMDGLPLALVQAGAYVVETACSLADYLELYKTHHKELLARHSRLMLDYPETVATTWSLSFQQIEQQSPTAADLLRLCAFLAPDAIPEELLMRGITEQVLTLGTEAGDQFKLNEALGVLLRYSLVRREENTHVLSIHRLVQTVLKDDMDQETQRTWAERTVQTVNAIFPETSFRHRRKATIFLTRLPASRPGVCSTHLPVPSPLRGGIPATLPGWSFSVCPWLLSSVPGPSPAGPGHPQARPLGLSILLSPKVSPLWLYSQIIMGDFEQEEQFYQQALLIREKTLGPDNPDTTRSRNNLSVSYRNQGKYEQAEQLLQQALSISERMLGTEHLDTLNYVINLAKLYSEQNKYEQAEQLLKRALTTSERILEPGHPLIAYNLNLLAKLSYEQGNYEHGRAALEAIPRYP